MISRKLIAALVGLTLIGGTVAEASAATGPVATKSAITKSVSGPASKTVAKTPAKHHVGKIALKRHRLHVTHRMIKRAKVAKVSTSKRLALSHATKRVAPKHV